MKAKTPRVVKLKPPSNAPERVLVLDVGGSHVKCIVTDREASVDFVSGPRMSAQAMVDGVRKITRGWKFDAVSLGYPGVVREGRIVREPDNLAGGWMGYDFDAAFGRPVRIINDAAMQALGAYRDGRMLFLGLGTGLGSALIYDRTIVPMELGHLQYTRKHNYEHFVGAQGLQRLGVRKWMKEVDAVVEGFRRALLPDYIVLGGGNAIRLTELRPHTFRGGNADAFTGGFRLWQPDHGVAAKR